MGQFRFTIARWMVMVAVLAANAGLVRACVIDEMFHAAFLMFIALQVGLWCALRSRGGVRRFWLGFEVSGVASVLALFYCEVFPFSTLNHLIMRYMHITFNLVQLYLPTQVDDVVMDHQDWFLIVVYFLPEFVAAVLGGLIAARLPRTRQMPGGERLQTRNT